MVTERNQVVRKVTFTLPASLLSRLDERVPSREQSAFVARAIKAQLAIKEQADALAAAAGAWRDDEYPHMATEDDVDRWLSELRSSPMTSPD